MRVRKLSWACCAVAAAVALGACGGGGGASSNGIASKSPSEIVTAAENAARGAHSVRVSGLVSTSGQMVSLDLHLVNGTGAAGTIATSGLGVQIIEVGNTVYLKGDRAFWARVAGAGPGQLFAGKWLKAPAGGNLAVFAQFTDLKGLFQKLFASHGTLTKGGTATVDGQKVIALDDTSQGGTLYVATSGKPYPIQLKKSGTGGGHVDFTEYDRPVALTAPKGALDISQLHR